VRLCNVADRYTILHDRTLPEFHATVLDQVDW